MHTMSPSRSSMIPSYVFFTFQLRETRESQFCIEPQ